MDYEGTALVANSPGLCMKFATVQTPDPSFQLQSKHYTQTKFSLDGGSGEGAGESFILVPSQLCKSVYDYVGSCRVYIPV